MGYVSGARMKISEATFHITQKPEKLSETVTITGNATTPKGKTFRFEEQRAVVRGNYIVTKPMLANKHLATRKTQFVKPMTIDWRVKYKKDGIPKTKDLGSSKHTVYVTLKKPNTGEFHTLYLTALHLATSNPGAKGTLGEAKKQAIEKTWKRFETQKITNWDNKPLYYYKSGHGFSYTPSCLISQATAQFLGEFLTSSEGQCDAFEKLFQAALAANGIQSTRISVKSKPYEYVDSNGMRKSDEPNILIKNWNYSNPTLNDTSPYQWRFIINEEDGGYYGMVPKNDNNRYGDLTSEVGLAGQNSPTPSEKVCGRHFIVKVTDEKAIKEGGLTTFYYDPSYGVSYHGEKEEAQRDFENKAVDGYFRFFEKEDQNEPDGYFRVQQSRGLDKILFSQ